MSNPKIGLHANAPHRRGGPHRKGTKPSPSKKASVSRFLRCPACGARRGQDCFGNAYEPGAWLCMAGGYKAISWKAMDATSADRKLAAAALRRALERMGDP